MRRAHRYIPEVLLSAAGHNKTTVGLHFVREHAYDSPEAYGRYMAHPFHANIYDRYLLNDSPERIVTDNAYDGGLLGYSLQHSGLSPAWWSRATPRPTAPDPTAG